MLGPAPDTAVAYQPPQNWHLTVAFYGEVPDGLAQALAARWPLLDPGCGPFSAELAGAGMFGRRIAWVGAQVDDPAWRALTRALSGAELGLGGDDRQERSRPHLTIARVSPTAASRPAARSRRARPNARPGFADEVAAAVQALSVYRGPAWTVDSVTLFASELGQGIDRHPRYTPLATLPLTSIDNND